MIRKIVTVLWILLVLFGCDTSSNQKNIDISLQDDVDIQLSPRTLYEFDDDALVNDVAVYRNNFYLIDAVNNKVYVLDKNTKAIETLIAQDFGLPYFNPTGLTLSEPFLYILDSANQQIIKWNLENQSRHVTEIKGLDSAMLSSLMSLAVFDNNMYLSVMANNKKANNIYKISPDGTLNSIMTSFIGYLNIIEDRIYATNSYFLTEGNGVYEISTGESSIISLKSDVSQEEYVLDSKIAPFKLIKLGDYYLTSSLGTASIIKYDLDYKKSKVIFSLTDSEIDEASIGMLIMDQDNTLYLIDNSNHRVIELEYDDERYMVEY